MTFEYYSQKSGTGGEKHIRILYYDIRFVIMYATTEMSATLRIFCEIYH